MRVLFFLLHQLVAMNYRTSYAMILTGSCSWYVRGMFWCIHIGVCQCMQPRVSRLMQPPAGAKVGERVMAEGEAQLDHAGSSFDDFSSHFPSPNWSRQSGLLVSPHSSLYFHIVHIFANAISCCFSPATVETCQAWRC